MITLITIKIFSTRIEAEIAKGLLTANNIRSVISADDAGSMRPFPFSYVQGVELKVAESDLRKAGLLLKKTGKNI